MTRAEYEKRYGVKPVFSTSTLDTTPTRIRMTREEYNEIYGPEKKNAVIQNLNPFSETNVNRLKDIPSDIKESYTGIKEAGQTAARSLSDIWKNKDLTVVQKSAATLPGIASGAVNMAGTAALAPVKLLTTDEFEKKVAKKFAGAIESTMEAKVPFVDKSMTEIYDGMSDENKFIVSKLFAPVANVVTSVTTAGKAVPLAEQVVKTVAKNVPDVGATLKKAADNFSFRGEEKALRSVVDEIAKVEEKYAPIRKSNQFAKDVEGSRTRIAQSNVLEQAVDESGKINGEVASKLYKQMTIDDTEGLVRNLLKDENATISIDSLKEVMENTILKSRLEGNDLVKALDSIEGELKGLRIRGDEAGNIPLYKVHDAKISATDGINYLSPATDKAYRKAIAETYRQVVEKESKIEMDVDGKKATVADVNKQLSMYLDDIRRIKALDGRIVDRGKLGKYASSLAGTGIGMAVGSLGGPLAAAAGGAIGGKVASKITSTSMQNTFKKGVKGVVPEDKILKAAKLRVADKPLVAPKGVPKTKAIKETEDLIKKNVEMQKTAIKANDFTLVAKLKEIYAKLVAKLKDLVTEVVEAQKNPQTGQKGSVDFFAPLPKKVSKIVADMTEEDAAILRKIVDNKYDRTPIQTNRTLKEMGMEKLSYGEQKELAAKILKGYDERWGGVDEVGVATTRPGALDIKKPTTLMEEAKKYKTTVNIKDKDDLEYLSQILSRDSIEDIKNGKMTNWRGDSYEDLAKVNIISKTPQTVAQKLEGKVKEIKLPQDIFYHGTSGQSAEEIMRSGFKTGASLPEDAFRGGGYGRMQNSISLAETPKEASIFSQLSRDGQIVEVKLKDNAKVVSIDGIEDAIDLEDFISYLRKQKVDAVYIGGGEKELVVINPKAVIPTRTQLEDIWKKANRTASADGK